MVDFNDADDFMTTMAEGGKAMRFRDIDGIGPKTADKITSIRGVRAPTDVEDYSAEALASEAGISQKRARKAIKNGGGNPSLDERSKSTGTVSAGGLADSLDQKKQRSASIVQERRGVFEKLVDTAEDVPERRERDKDPTQIPFYEEDTDTVQQIGQAADLFSEATADPIDPTVETPDLGFTEEDREKAAEVRLAAEKVIQERESKDRDNVRSATTSNSQDPPEFGAVNSVLTATGMLTIGEFEVSKTEKEEAEEEFAQQSPEAKRVDKRRRAPITTNEDVYAQAPGRYDFPGVDTPTDDPQVQQKDAQTVDAEDTTLDSREGSLFIRENNQTNSMMPTLKGVFPTARSPGRETSEQSASLADEMLGVDTDEKSTINAVADITFLEREKDGFGETLIPFEAAESDKTRYDF